MGWVLSHHLCDCRPYSVFHHFVFIWLRQHGSLVFWFIFFQFLTGRVSRVFIGLPFFYWGVFLPDRIWTSLLEMKEHEPSCLLFTYSCRFSVLASPFPASPTIKRCLFSTIATLSLRSRLRLCFQELIPKWSTSCKPFILIGQYAYVAYCLYFLAIMQQGSWVRTTWQVYLKIWHNGLDTRKLISIRGLSLQ